MQCETIALSGKPQTWFCVCFSQAGRSRSATIVTAYLMKRYKLGFTEAYHRLKSLKPDVQ